MNSTGIDPSSERSHGDLPLSWMDRAAIAIAMGFGTGLSPKAPGTVGSLLGLLLGVGLFHACQSLESWSAPFGFSPLWWSVCFYLVVYGLLTAVAYGSIALMESRLHVHDDPRTVVDEVLGQAIAVGFMTPNLIHYALAFLLFRTLDIAKPGLIGKIDRDVSGPWGTLGDDVLAGVVALVALQLLLLNPWIYELGALN